MSSSNQKGGAITDSFSGRSLIKAEEGEEEGCAKDPRGRFLDWNLIPLLEYGKFSLDNTDDNPDAPEYHHDESNMDWNRCNREVKGLDPAPNPVELAHLNPDEKQWVITLLAQHEEEMDLFSLITQEDVYDYFYRALSRAGLDDDAEEDDPGDHPELLKKLQEKWKAGPAQRDAARRRWHRAVQAEHAQRRRLHGAQQTQDMASVAKAMDMASVAKAMDAELLLMEHKRKENRDLRRRLGLAPPTGGSEGGKKSRRKRTKSRTTGGKKSRRRLRKRTTIKGGKRKRRRTRRRR